jgi:chemotaxis protein CheC
MRSRTLTNALDTRQTDALTELINIAFGLTASKLSQITGSRVVIDVPTVGLDLTDDLTKDLGSLYGGEVVAVSQSFTGPISGDAMLLLNHEAAVRLGNAFVEEGLQSNRLDSSTSEILIEIGNMLLGACLGILGNLLEVRVNFSPPVLRLEAVKSIGGDERRHTLVMATSFRIQQREVAGKLALVLSSSSLKRLIQAVGVWENSQCLA